MRNKVRFAMFSLLIGAGFALAPAAFARGHVGISIGLPGLSLGYSDCRHCYGGGYYGGGYFGGAYGAAYYAPAPVYYAPAPVYYGPAASYGVAYDNYPGYRGAYYGGPARGYYHPGRYDQRGGPGNGRRATYYDRGGYHR